MLCSFRCHIPVQSESSFAEVHRPRQSFDPHAWCLEHKGFLALSSLFFVEASERLLRRQLQAQAGLITVRCRHSCGGALPIRMFTIFHGIIMSKVLAVSKTVVRAMAHIDKRVQHPRAKQSCPESSIGEGFLFLEPFEMDNFLIQRADS